MVFEKHYGENIGDTDTHALFVELKEPDPASAAREGGVRGPRLPDR